MVPSAPPTIEPLIPTRWWALPGWLTPPREPMAARTFVLLLLAVWLVGTLVRMAWLFRVGWSADALQWDGVPILATEDAFFFGTGADIALHGNLHSLVRFPAADQHAIVALAWLVTKISPFSLAEVLLYLPALVAPLIAVPTALLGRDVAGPRAGILAGLIVVVAPTFVGRSSAGYFDTDLFSVAVPLFAVWLIVRLLRHGAARDGLIAAMLLSAFPFFYSQGGPVAAIIAVATALVLVAFHRTDTFFAPTLAVLGLAQLPLPWFVRTALLVPVWFAFRRLPLPRNALVWGAIAVALVGFVLSSEWAAALARIRDFVGASSPVGAGLEGAADPGIVLGDTTRYVGEAKHLDIANLGRDAVGSLPALIGAALGWLALQLRHRALLVVAPLIGLGLFAIFGGNRFVIYASAPAAIGVAAAITILAARLRQPALRLVLIVALGAAAVVPAAITASGSVNRSSLVRGEVESLVALSKVVQPGDTTIAWWDWGYAIAYYAHSRTLVDGGERGDDAALVAEVLMSPSQHGAAMLARLAVEVANRNGASGGSVSRGLFKAVREQIGVPQMDYLRAIADPATQPPAATSAVYLYLPVRMLRILPVLEVLRPHEPGVTPVKPSYGTSWAATALANPARIDLKNGFMVFVDEAVIRGQGKMRPLRAVHVVRGYGATQTIDSHPHPSPPAGALTGIYLADENVYVEVNDTLFASLYIQLFMLGNADPELFELVFANPVARVYRLRI